MSENILNSTIVNAKRDLAAADLEGEAVILSIDKGIYYGLNDVATRIWAIIQEPISLANIVESLLEEYDIERTKCEKDVRRLLDVLTENGLIETTDAKTP